MKTSHFFLLGIAAVAVYAVTKKRTTGSFYPSAYQATSQGLLGVGRRRQVMVRPAGNSILRGGAYSDVEYV